MSIPDTSRAAWRKASRSNANGSNCVEVAFLGDVIAVRDSKNPTGGALVVTGAEWQAFLRGVRDGEFDLNVHRTQGRDRRS